jgi:hypothetical protein
MSLEKVIRNYYKDIHIKKLNDSQNKEQDVE